ncbi:MAG: YtxH domain-containing protein [Prevotella sp.]
MNTTNELELMRQQLAILNKKVEKESIINDRLMRKVMKSRLSLIVRTHAVMAALCLAGMANCWLLYHLLGISAACCIYTLAFFIIAAVYTYFTGRDLYDRNLMSGNLVEVRRKVVRSKQLEHHWLKIGIPMATVFFVWFFMDLGLGEDINRPLLIGAVAGGVIGLTLGLTTRRKIMNAYDEVIEQLNELTAEDTGNGTCKI